MTVLEIPETCLVVLVGVSGSGKSTFARAQFPPTQVLSSDTFRGMVADDENDQSASGDAFDVLNYVAGPRRRSRPRRSPTPGVRLRRPRARVRAGRPPPVTPTNHAAAGQPPRGWLADAVVRLVSAAVQPKDIGRSRK